MNQQQQTQHVNVFTTALFAHYLSIRCLSVVQGHPLVPSSLTDESQRYNKCVDESSEMYITDVLAFKSVCGVKYSGSFRKVMFAEHQAKPMTALRLDTTDLVELLKQSAVEHLTTYRQLEARKFAPVLNIVTTEYAALYAYRYGEYQRCFQLSMHNVRSLVGDTGVGSPVIAYPEFIQLMDDDVVSLVGLMLIVDPLCRKNTEHDLDSVSQLVLSLYLMTQCQIKLHRRVKSLAQTLVYIGVSRQRVDEERTLDQLLLKLTERKLLSYISSLYNVDVIDLLILYGQDYRFTVKKSRPEIYFVPSP